MNFKNITACLMTATIAFTGLSANASERMDVRSKTGFRYIKVELSQNKRLIKFTKCEARTNYCESKGLGPRNWYSVEAIKDQRSIEGWQILGSAAADAGIVALTAFTGGLVFSMAIAGSAVETGVGVAMVAGGAGGTAIGHYTSAINPVNQYRQWSALDDDILGDADVLESNDADVELVIENLVDVLNKL